MLTKPRYTVVDFAFWSRYESAYLVAFVSFVTVMYEVFDWTFLEVPWTPVALIGTAVAFMIGFQNNAVYDRIWKARKIWGGVVNTSRTWGMKTRNLLDNNSAKTPLSDEELKKTKETLVMRHVAWLTALRHSMRQKRKWEVTQQHVTNREWAEKIWIPETVNTIKEDLEPYLSNEELCKVLSNDNRASTVLYLQSEHLQKLRDRGLLDEFSFLNLQNVLEELFTLQGQSERIKNFPYPRQYATLSYMFVWIFIILLPFGIVATFHDIGVEIGKHYSTAQPYFVWLSIPFCTVISWIFYTMERIGRVGENPFEGSPNDVPISTISRGIEIDMRQQLGEERMTIPEQFPEMHDVQM